MRIITTVMIEEDLRFRAKKLAVNQHTSFKAIVDEALTAYLQKAEKKESKKK
jgi:predicted transcriptional regulator